MDGQGRRLEKFEWREEKYGPHLRKTVLTLLNISVRDGRNVWNDNLWKGRDDDTNGKGRMQWEGNILEFPTREV